MKRSLIEVFKYIDLITWYSAIRVNNLWLSAGTCDEIVNGIFGCPTYEVYLQTKNRKHHYFYTTKNIASRMRYDDQLFIDFGTKYNMHLFDDPFYKKLELLCKFVNDKGTFVFHKITKDIPIMSSDYYSIIAINTSHVDDPIYGILIVDSNTNGIRQTIWKEFQYHTNKYGIEVMIHRSIQNPEKRLDLCASYNYNKYILVGIAVLGIVGYYASKTKN